MLAGSSIVRVPQVSQDKRFRGKLQKHFGFGSGCGGAVASAAAGGGGGSGERDMFAAVC